MYALAVVELLIFLGFGFFLFICFRFYFIVLRVVICWVLRVKK